MEESYESEEISKKGIAYKCEKFIELLLKAYFYCSSLVSSRHSSS